METKELYQLLDNKFEDIFLRYNFRYKLNKLRGKGDVWQVKIGRYKTITDPYLQGKIEGYGICGDIDKQFEDLLNQAIKDEQINY